MPPAHTPPEVTPAQPSFPSPQPAVTPPSATTPTAVPSAAAQGSGKKWVGIIGGGALLAALIGGGVFVALNDDDDPVAITTTVVETTTTTEAPTTTTTEPRPPTVAELATSTVMVMMIDRNDVPICFGSGTIVEDDGTILTNAHVVARDPICNYETIQIAVTDDSGVPPVPTYEADLLAVDADLDLAVLRAARDLDGNPISETFTTTIIGDSDLVSIGDDIRILGYPSIGGDTITFTNGSVSGFTAQAGVGERSWIKTDATIAGGNSGGTAVNDAGELIGIPTQGGASNDSPIVDCRVLTDTNGDGVVNGADQCVPFGGFLNGIRPVNLALPILAEARTAAPITFEAEGPTNVNLDDLYFYYPGFSLGPPDEAGEAEFVVTASSVHTDLCLWVAWEGMVTGAVWDAVWLIDDEINDDYSFFNQRWEEASEGTDFWVCANEPEGFEPGLYEIAFLVEGEVIFIEALEVTAEPTPVHNVSFLNQTDDAVCYLTINPLGSSEIGLDQLGITEILEIGDSKSFALPAGTMRVGAYDCDGELLVETTDGLVVDGDLSYTLVG